MVWNIEKGEEKSSYVNLHPLKKKKNGLWKEKMKETESSGRGNLLGEIGCIVEEWFEK